MWATCPCLQSGFSERFTSEDNLLPSRVLTRRVSSSRKPRGDFSPRYYIRNIDAVEPLVKTQDWASAEEVDEPFVGDGADREEARYRDCIGEPAVDVLAHDLPTVKDQNHDQGTTGHEYHG